MKILKNTRPAATRLFFLSALLFCAMQIVPAQITITLPKIPKIKKPKIEPAREPEQQTTTVDQTVQNQTSESKTTSQTSSEDDAMDFRLKMFLEDIEKAKKEVDEFDANDKLYLVGTTSTEWMWRAVSPKERGEWIEKWKTLMTPTSRKKFDAALDALATAAAVKLPAYRAHLKDYTVRNPAEEKLMKGVLTRLADYKIFSTGLKQSNWLIATNDIGIPTARYKHGVIYLRDTKSDHPYCYATYINIKQDYAGGGTYGASYARFIEDEMVGCPAGK